jgi:hypothetical protein
MADPIGELARSRNGTWSRRDPTTYGALLRQLGLGTASGNGDAMVPAERAGARRSKRTKPETHAPVIPLPVRRPPACLPTPALQRCDVRDRKKGVGVRVGCRLGTNPNPNPNDSPHRMSLSFLSCPDRAAATPH